MDFAVSISSICSYFSLIQLSSYLATSLFFIQPTKFQLAIQLPKMWTAIKRPGTRRHQISTSQLQYLDYLCMFVRYNICTAVLEAFNQSCTFLNPNKSNVGGKDDETKCIYWLLWSFQSCHMIHLSILNFPSWFEPLILSQQRRSRSVCSAHIRWRFQHWQFCDHRVHLFC